MKKSSSSAPAQTGVLTLAACCILLATCSQARRISHRHDVGAPQEALDTGGWRPVVESGRPSLDQVAVAPTGYDGDSDLVPPPRRVSVPKGSKKRVAQAGAASSAVLTYSTPSYAASPVRFPGEKESSKRRPIRRHRPGAGHLRPYIAQESAQQQVRFKPSPPAPENLWTEPTEPTVGFFTPQQYNEGPLQLAIASQGHSYQQQQQQQVVSTQQVYGNPAFFDLGHSIRRPQDNAFIEPSVHENEVIQGVHHLAVNSPKYQIDTPSSPPPQRRRRPKPRTTTTQPTPIEPEMHRGPEIHEAPAWTTEAPTVQRWPLPDIHVEEEEQEPVRPRRPFRPPPPVQEQPDDDMEVPSFKLRPRKPIVAPPAAEENTYQEERPRIRRPHPANAPVVQEDLEEEVSPARPQQQEEERPLKRRRPRPPGEGGQRRRRPKPRPQPVVVVEEEEQQQQPQPEVEEDRNAHRRPIPSWPTKAAVTEESIQEQHPEVEQENYPSVFPQQHQQQQQEEIIQEEVPSQETVEETFPSSIEAFEQPQQPIPEEPNHQEPNQVSSTEGLFSIPPKRKRPEIFESTAAPAVTTTTTAPPTTTTSISSRLRAKLGATRPRFSLNNIKERLRQQQEQANKEEAVTTEAPKPGKFQVGTLPTTTSEAPVERQTFRPSMSRYTRPPLSSSRYRGSTTTTEVPAEVATPAPSAARRTIPSLYNKERRPLIRTRTTTEAPLTTTEEIEVPHEEDEDKEMESTTQEIEEMTTIMPVSSTTPEDFSYAKRVTDLTSSATAFKPLSFFSAVPANGVHASQLRFTMATEDPILPIEAFFPAFASKQAKPHGE